MVILFGGEKGGTGKSTLATNLACALARGGSDVLLLDTDPQGSADGWANTRSESADLPKVHSLQKFKDVVGAVNDLKSRYQHIIIDAGGRDSRELRSAMVAAEKMYVPIKPSQFDLWTVGGMDELVNQSRGFNASLQAWALLSMAPTNPVINEARDAQEMLAEFENLGLANTIIRERKVYRDAIIQGRGVLEMENAKAKFEIEDLMKEVLNGTRE